MKSNLLNMECRKGCRIGIDTGGCFAMFSSPQVMGDTLSLTFSGDLDHIAADRLRGEYALLVRNIAIRHIRIDMGQVGMMDSSGIALLIGWYRQVITRGGSITLFNVSNSVSKVLSIGGMQKLVNVEVAS